MYTSEVKLWILHYMPITWLSCIMNWFLLSDVRNLLPLPMLPPKHGIFFWENFRIPLKSHLSGNIIKNVKGVTVPNSGGLKGIDIAALLGITGGNADKALEVLEGIRPEHIRQAQELAENHVCSCTLAEGVSNLYICAKVCKGSHYAEVTIVDQHTNITKIVKDGQVLFSGETTEKKPEEPPFDKSKLTVKDILDFADQVKIEDVQELLERQIRLNTAISQEGLDNNYGRRSAKL